LCIKEDVFVFGFHPMGEKVFWLKPLYQLGFVRFLVSIFGLGS